MNAAAGTSRDLASLVGTVLDGTYRLDQLIGEGGMGAVFRGRHVIMMRDVAIKVLHPDFNRDPELVRRFDREAQSAARLDHPNCIHVSAYGTTEDGMRYLVMQLLEGVELADLLTEPTAPKRVVEWSIQILRGLEHAHSQGVIHRDLKPQNVFLTRDAHGNQLLKLVDFGIAKLVGSDAGDPLTRAGMVFGTPQYMSPEQALGVEIDPRADLYAVGILMFQMLTGRLPFNHEDAIALIRMQVSTEPPQLPDNVPQELAAIVYRLLAKQREQRFPDARTVRAALERYRSNMSHKGRGDTSDPLLDIGSVTTDTATRPLPEALRPRQLDFVESVLQTDRWSRRTWFKAAIAGCVVLALASAGLIYWLFFSGDPAAPASPIRPRPRAPPIRARQASLRPPAELALQPCPRARSERPRAGDPRRPDQAGQARRGPDPDRRPARALPRPRAAGVARRPAAGEAADDARVGGAPLRRGAEEVARPRARPRLHRRGRRPAAQASVHRRRDRPGDRPRRRRRADPRPLHQRRQAVGHLGPAATAPRRPPGRRRRPDRRRPQPPPRPRAVRRGARPVRGRVAGAAGDPGRAAGRLCPGAQGGRGPGDARRRPANPACDQAAALLATVRTAYAGRFPEAFAPAKPVKKKPVTKKKKKKVTSETTSAIRSLT
ncbi:protein kinase domain-containing protein [Nannocystis pusilla]|uniref:serine/threonine-protein kinase n=1 Tax=Nannocystis pusilla TaxID=889268 RepID=UPI003B7CDD0A